MKGWRTIVFNVIMALGALVTLLTGVSVQDDVATLANGVDLILEGIIAVWAIGAVWLRMITDSPVFKGRKDDSSTPS
jgi:hypothetical protein